MASFMLGSLAAVEARRIEGWRDARGGGPSAPAEPYERRLVVVQLRDHQTRRLSDLVLDVDEVPALVDRLQRAHATLEPPA